MVVFMIYILAADKDNNPNRICDDTDNWKHKSSKTYLE